MSDQPPTAAEVAAAWDRELPGVATGSIGVVTPLWRAAKLLADERRRTLERLGVDAATLDLLSTLRRAGEPWTLTTRQLAARTLVTAGAVSQRVARAEREGLVTRETSDASRRAVGVTLTTQGHTVIERVVRDLLAHEESLLAALAPEDRDALAVSLPRLLSVLPGAPSARP